MTTTPGSAADAVSGAVEGASDMRGSFGAVVFILADVRGGWKGRGVGDLRISPRLERLPLL